MWRNTYHPAFVSFCPLRTAIQLCFVHRRQNQKQNKVHPAVHVTGKQNSLTRRSYQKPTAKWKQQLEFYGQKV